MTPKSMAGQRGVALITVLLVMVIAIAAVTHTILRNRIAISRTAALLANTQMAEFVHGAEAWTKIALERDHEQDRENPQSADSALDSWALEALQFNPDNGKMRIKIKDLNSCFNVNNLAGSGQASADQRAIFERLVRSVSGKGDLASAMLDWVDSGDTPLTPGTEDNGYLGREIAHRTPDIPITDISELSAVQGMEREDWEALRPFLCALPESGTVINVNFAPAELLEAMAPGARASQIKSFREADGVFTEASQLAPYGLGGVAGLVFHSQYFLAQIAVQLGPGPENRQYWETTFRLDQGRGEVSMVQRQRRMFSGNEVRELLESESASGEKTNENNDV
ncbi:type II secretion system minor pseudopilin GspK [Microbulbifer sp. YPW16]|uniref:type II secretion system minor pseudopilin GspK n=1 Tax=Microbulbifer sp. YPW16 TaxID=2904242 RepID=UPI001E323322|nr:type II secretion system minor pseudopilin GspK [Microbulbifer sp. YPW16]UHQ55747.1 type II secretion system minor pseudopilin GspK [Microbulbifer sp. YPW16]